MWRSCLRLLNGGRRLLNRPRGGLSASVGPRSNPQPPARAYVPPTDREKRSPGRDHPRAHSASPQERQYHVRLFTRMIAFLSNKESRCILVFRQGKRGSGSRLRQGQDQRFVEGKVRPFSCAPGPRRGLDLQHSVFQPCHFARFWPSLLLPCHNPCPVC